MSCTRCTTDATGEGFWRLNLENGLPNRFQKLQIDNLNFRGIFGFAIFLHTKPLVELP